MLNLPTDLLKRFQDLICLKTSLSFSSSRLANLETQMRNRVKENGMASYEDYFQLLKDDGKELEALIESLTTKQTYFFRLPGQFKALEEQVVPELEEKLSSQAQRCLSETEGKIIGAKIFLRVWSAGASTGEEAYSIAMSLKESLKYPRAWKSEILATDISKDALGKAEQAFYETEPLRQIPPQYKKKYTMSIKDGSVMANELRQMISFRVFNLRELAPQNNAGLVMHDLKGEKEAYDLRERFDVIFCRNVMIYFDFPGQQRLLDGLFLCLKPGGYLFTGDAEILHPYRHNFEAINYGGTSFYRKPENLNFLKKVETNDGK